MADEELAPPTPKAPTRDEIRAAVFATKAPKKEIVAFFGTKIELRQPSLGQILDVNSSEGQSAAIQTLVSYAYVPGTDQRCFEDGDVEAFKSMPFGQDFVNVTEALARLTQVNFTRSDNS